MVMNAENVDDVRDEKSRLLVLIPDMMSWYWWLVEDHGRRH